MADGRELAWLQLGTPEGVPVFAFHGSPGSRYDFANQDAVAGERGVRLIVPDRPGYGHSTYDPNRSFASWAEDVGQLADQLGLEEFGVLGVSSGGPNAAACARFIGDRLTGCAIVSGPAPSDAGIAPDGMLPANRVAHRLCRVAPGLLVPLMALGLRRGRRAPEEMVSWMVRSLPSPDAAVLGRPEVRDLMVSNARRPLAATAARAAVQDFRLELRPWGFRLEDIKIQVHVWHGDTDRNVLVANGAYQARTIPNSTLHLLAGEGHALFHDHFDQILDNVIS
ncbi:MAG TPA: alpha/beta hydrolase [Acidimicrobiia bacterium]